MKMASVMKMKSDNEEMAKEIVSWRRWQRNGWRNESYHQPMAIAASIRQHERRSA